MTTGIAKPGSPATAPRFVTTLASEWAKLWTLRFTRAMLLLALALAAASAAVFLLTTGVTRGESLVEMRPLDVAGASLLGVDFANLVLVVLGASAVASEYSTGQIRPTLVATPRRWKVLAAKATVLTATALLAGALASVAAFGAGQVVLLAQGLPTMSLEDPRISRLVFGSALMVPLYSLFAVAFAFITRNTGAAVAAVLAIMSVPALVGALPEWWQVNLLPLLPASALHSLSGVASPDTLEYLRPGSAIAVLVGWAAVVLVAAYASFAGRDA
jgi:ABC-2 type transport system permease protein